MFLTGIGTATPATRYTQAQCHEALQRSPQYARLGRPGRALLQRLLSRSNGIDMRALALDPLDEAFLAEPDVLHRRFARHAPQLAAAAAREALREAACDAREIDGVIVSTCTGYLCPGLTSYVIEALNLRADAIALDLVGQGCGAALPNLRTAEAYIASGRADRMLSICVEVCSAAFYIDDDPGVLVSACLFGDGAGAAVVSRDRVPGRACAQWRAAETLTDPAHRDALRFETREGMLRNILTPAVPDLAAEYAERVLDDVLRREGLTREAIRTWIWHAGGRTVLEALQRRLGLDPEHVKHSAEVLRELGNVSSACVYFVLQRALRNGCAPGWWWMSSFGAGFTCHGALLDVRAA
ncbi:MAG TPA: 3-oxoacyl-[acyl-carrier-protein] synthase III C-terminal domain-containing protein [Burkholderiales bacterium]|nr:3-oxoacyl-[acyl-carrier-protein] synthase III C-terminal domain-containing protein [Burkholderiales bacterium]